MLGKKVSMLALVFTSCLCLGCGSSLDRVGISGIVVYEGEPLEGAEVMFRPEAGPSSGATTNAQGEYRIDKSYGPVSGACEVRVVKMAVPAAGPGKAASIYETNILPNRFREDPMIVTFESGQHTLDIDLDKWKQN